MATEPRSFFRRSCLGLGPAASKVLDESAPADMNDRFATNHAVPMSVHLVGELPWSPANGRGAFG